MPIALTDYQLAVIRRGAASPPESARAEYLQQVAARLGNEPSDAAAVDLVLDSAASTSGRLT